MIPATQYLRLASSADRMNRGAMSSFDVGFGKFIWYVIIGREIAYHVDQEAFDSIQTESRNPNLSQGKVEVYGQLKRPPDLSIILKARLCIRLI